MQKKYVAIMVVLALLLVAGPAQAHANPGYLLRESGSTECSPPKTVKTWIKAKGDHKHKASFSIIIHLPDNGFYYTTPVNWGVYAANWVLYNQLFRSYDYYGSQGGCSSS